jgi:hypothetical protein
MACRLYPDDLKIQQLKREECNTDNLSPWPGVANNKERLNHDEFMRRLLCLTPINGMRQRRIDKIGQLYLRKVCKLGFITRSASIAGYEGGGLERVFRAILESQHWDRIQMPPCRSCSKIDWHHATQGRMACSWRVIITCSRARVLISAIPGTTVRLLPRPVRN